MKKLFIFIVIAVLQLCSSLYATGPDTLWTREFGYGILGAPEEGFEFHPTNDSIFIYTGRTYVNDVKNDTFAVHFVNTITGHEYLRYGPIHHAHFTPDGNFLIGHNDSTLAYISLDSMKPVRTYPVIPQLQNFTIDEKGKYVYSSFSYMDSIGKFGFYRWDISNGTIKKVYLPDTLLYDGGTSCPITGIGIGNMLASDTAKVLLMEIVVGRPYPLCDIEYRVWGIDLTADTVKYDFTKIHPTYTSSSLDKILPKRNQFIAHGQKYENYEKSSFYNVFDVASGDSIKDRLRGSYSDYTISNDESYIITSDIVIYPNIQLNVFQFNNFDTVYIYHDVYLGPLTISPNNKFILQDSDLWFTLYSTPWFPTSIIKPKDDESNDLLIYPNPAFDFIEINIGDVIPAEEGIQVRIYDILGMELKGMDSRLRGNDSNGQGGGKVRVDVSSLVPGIYFVQIGNVVTKFAKI